MKKVIKRGRPLGSKNKGGGKVVKNRTTALESVRLTELSRLRLLSERQDQAIAQATDQIADLQAQLDFYRKQVNHLLALTNILAKGA